MLQNMNYLSMLCLNLLLVGTWHGTTFLLSTRLADTDFQPDSGFFREWKWEKGGLWYRRYLYIHLWKDRVPQFISRNGFSKKHIQALTFPYIDHFISETCRGEWMHTWNLGCIGLILAVNHSLAGVTFSFLIFLGNGPFAIIQRYNRFRLKTVRRKLQRDGRRAAATT